jgi:IS1 family transposase
LAFTVFLLLESTCWFPLGFSGPPMACSTVARANWLTSRPFLYLGLIMVDTPNHLRKATERRDFLSSRAAIWRRRSLTQVARGKPASSAASLNPCFSLPDSRNSTYSSRGFSFLGRPRLATELLYYQKLVKSIRERISPASIPLDEKSQHWFKQPLAGYIHQIVPLVIGELALLITQDYPTVGHGEVERISTGRVSADDLPCFRYELNRCNQWGYGIALERGDSHLANSWRLEPKLNILKLAIAEKLIQPRANPLPQFRRTVPQDFLIAGTQFVYVSLENKLVGLLLFKLSYPIRLENHQLLLPIVCFCGNPKTKIDLEAAHLHAPHHITWAIGVYPQQILLTSHTFCGYNKSMNQLSMGKRTAVITALVEGCSINATARMTGVAKNTILKLLADVGSACADFQDRVLRNLKCKRIQCDEIWQFCYAKEKNVPAHFKGQFGYGDVWTWVAIDADSKLVPSFMLGRRDARTATIFIDDLKSRLGNRVQLTTDGLRVYLDAVEGAFGSDVDYAQLIKIYASTQEETRYSPPECVGCEKQVIMGNPDKKHISTSYSERQNLSMRMHMRRFTRLTNAHSKKIENLGYALALYFMYYNFARIHETIRCTPAMEAGVSDYVWSIQEIVGLADRPKSK